MDTELHDSYAREVENLKEEVKVELIAGVKASQKMILINTLERLGVDYLFKKEIEDQLEKIYAVYEETNIDYDLCTTALHFRILRQHGYNVSSDAFNKFKDNSGSFKAKLMNDLDGILSLYEASYMMLNGEETLEHALSFTKAHLESIAPTLSPFMATQVNHALEQPLHRSVPRIEARKYISVYEMDSLRDEKILRLAKVDFNRVQLFHKRELLLLSRWWKNLKLNFTYARDRLVESFLWAAFVHFEPEYSWMRIIFTKAITWLALADDSYDAYGTLDELSTFTQAIERWDWVAVDQLPDYLKPLHTEIFSYHDELEKTLEKKGTSYALHYSKEAFKVHIGSYGEESEWLKKGYVPSFDEYISCRSKSSSNTLVAIAFVGLGELVTPQAFEWMSNENEMIRASAIIGRITNDIAGYKVEQQRDHVPSAIECYMKQYNVTEQGALDELHNMVEKEWSKINNEMLQTPAVFKPFLATIVNTTRVYTEFYKTYDGFTEPEALRDHVIALFINPIPL